MLMHQTINEVDIRRYKQCFQYGSYYTPDCLYINRMTGLTLTSIVKVARLTKMKPSDFTKRLKAGIKNANF